MMSVLSVFGLVQIGPQGADLCPFGYSTSEVGISVHLTSKDNQGHGIGGGETIATVTDI